MIAGPAWTLEGRASSAKEKAAIWRPFKLGTEEGQLSAIISKPPRLSFDKNQKPRDEARRIAANIAKLPEATAEAAVVVTDQ